MESVLLKHLCAGESMRERDVESLCQLCVHRAWATCRDHLSVQMEVLRCAANGLASASDLVRLASVRSMMTRSGSGKCLGASCVRHSLPDQAQQRELLWATCETYDFLIQDGKFYYEKSMQSVVRDTASSLPPLSLRSFSLSKQYNKQFYALASWGP